MKPSLNHVKAAPPASLLDPIKRNPPDLAHPNIDLPVNGNESAEHFSGKCPCCGKEARIKIIITHNPESSGNVAVK